MFQNSTLPSISGDITRNIADALPRVRSLPGLAQLDQTLPLPNSFREYLVWLLALVGVTVLALLQVWAALQISHAQNELSTLQAQSVVVEQENAQLLWEISHFTTLDRVQKEAVTAGYVPVLNRRYLEAQNTEATQSVDLPAPTVLAEPMAAWSVDVDTKPAEILVQAANLADGLSAWWAGVQKAIGDSTATTGAFLQQQLVKIDLSKYLWIGDPR